MGLFLALISLAIGIWLWPDGITSTPLGDLTLGELGQCLIATIFLIMVLGLLYASVTHDRIWPWRWTLPYFGNLMIRTAVMSFVVWLGYAALQSPNLGNVPGWGLVLSVIFWLGLLLGAMFDERLDLFKDFRIGIPGR